MPIDHPLLAAYVPTDSEPWDKIRASHLMNRAGFGGTVVEVDKVLKLGHKQAVDWLLDFPDSAAASVAAIAKATNSQASSSSAGVSSGAMSGNTSGTMSGEMSMSGDMSGAASGAASGAMASDVAGPDLSDLDGFPSEPRVYERMLTEKTPDEKRLMLQQYQQANRIALQKIMAWWMRRMTFGPYPLQEKLTFFWHGHFTTSAKDERSSRLMWRQNELLRSHAAGNFAVFVHAISRDPAMLDYLNNNQNRKAHPNENYARELMELFTLGIGNYTETDIKQAARAFTGWGHDGDEFVFRRGQHDYGTKTFFGQTGDFDGDDIVDLILKRPACAKFIAGELFSMLAYDNDDAELAAALGSVLADNNFELRPLIGTILRSKAFYSRQSIGVQVKSPVQLVLGTIRQLGIGMPPAPALESVLNQMGQMPMMPPNVRGWPGGHMWINTSTLYIRYNTGVWLAGGGAPSLTRVGRKDTDRPLRGMPSAVEFRPDVPGDAKQVVDTWVARLVQRPLEDSKRAVLIRELGDDPTNGDAQRRVVQLIVSMPEYQLC